MASKIEHTATHLKRRLREAADPAFRISQQRFSKERVRHLGVRTAEVRRLASTAAAEYRRNQLSVNRIIEIVEPLWHRGALEERVLAVLIISRFRKQLDQRHWSRFAEWAGTLGNWGETDTLATELLAALLQDAPALVKRLPSWTRSRDRWKRRAAAVALVPLVRRGRLVDAAFDICDRLADDHDDMVAKGTGWLLKEISRQQPDAVASYLLVNIDRLSRTTVRYACEKLPKKLRARVMSA